MSGNEWQKQVFITFRVHLFGASSCNISSACPASGEPKGEKHGEEGAPELRLARRIAKSATPGTIGMKICQDGDICDMMTLYWLYDVDLGNKNDASLVFFHGICSDLIIPVNREVLDLHLARSRSKVPQKAFPGLVGRELQESSFNQLLTKDLRAARLIPTQSLWAEENVLEKRNMPQKLETRVYGWIICLCLRISWDFPRFRDGASPVNNRQIR